MLTEVSKISKEAIREYQNSKLPGIMNYVMSHSAFYKDRFKDIDTSKILKLDDLVRLPVTTKEDLQRRNMDFICVDKEKVVDYLTTSGTLGSPVTFVETEKDLQRLALNEHLSFLCANTDSKDIVQLMVTLDRRFMVWPIFWDSDSWVQVLLGLGRATLNFSLILLEEQEPINWLLSRPFCLS